MDKLVTTFVGEIHFLKCPKLMMKSEAPKCIQMKHLNKTQNWSIGI